MNAPGYAALPFLQRLGIGLGFLSICVVLFVILVVANPMPPKAPPADEGVRGCHEFYRTIHGEGHIALVYSPGAADPDIAQSSRVLANYLNPAVKVAYTQERALAAYDTMVKACTAHGWFR